MSTDPQSTSSAPAPAEPSMTGTFVIGALVLLALAGWMGWEFYVAAASSAWPTTPATVSKLDIWEKTQTRASYKLYEVEIHYEYTVGGQKYTGKTFNSRNNHIDEAAIPAVRQKYAVGSQHPVRYSPLLASQSIVEPAISVTAWGKLGIGLVALACGVYCASWIFRK
jgi:hypothetical protein